MHVRPEEQRQVAQWQRITIYRYTLPPPYEATEHLFEELPLSTYPSGTTMEPLAYEMTPGAHLGRAAPWTQALVLFPPLAAGAARLVPNGEGLVSWETNEQTDCFDLDRFKLEHPDLCSEYQKPRALTRPFKVILVGD